jgi:SAM-dependent methyltransferase
MDDFWKTYWTGYGSSEATSEEDLFKQVAHTVSKQPIPNELVVRMLEQIVTRLQLSRADHLLDFCCGNGLFSYELAAHVAQVTGIDFVSRNIRTAQLRKSRENTTYIVGDAIAPLLRLVGIGCFPNKFLMHYSLAYFAPTQFAVMLRNILEHLGSRKFHFLVTGIPNAALKWNFYNTPERRARHVENEKQAGGTNDGLGRWWQADEIQQICRHHGLTVLIENQPLELSNYRMNALISSPVSNR